MNIVPKFFHISSVYDSSIIRKLWDSTHDQVHSNVLVRYLDIRACHRLVCDCIIAALIELLEQEPFWEFEATIST